MCMHSFRVLSFNESTSMAAYSLKNVACNSVPISLQTKVRSMRERIPLTRSCWSTHGSMGCCLGLTLLSWSCSRVLQDMGCFLFARVKRGLESMSSPSISRGVQRLVVACFPVFHYNGIHYWYYILISSCDICVPIVHLMILKISGFYHALECQMQ